jgi:molybdopterin/thiamine biosynthesis adenylyltransferase
VGIAMNLINRAYLFSEPGFSQQVIEDGPLLDWAAHTGRTPAEAVREALAQQIIPLRYAKNLMAISLAEQQRLVSSTVFICGCGGLGGILIQLLARAGVGRLRLADGDSFAPSNLNRQLLCDTRTLRQPKAQVAADTVRVINPFIEVTAYLEPLQEATALELICDADLVMDALDNLPARFVLAAAARRLELPFVHTAVAGWWGQLCTFLPDSPWDLTHVYGSFRERDAEELAMGIPGPMAAVMGSMEALEALRLLAGKRPAYADHLLYYDGENGVTEIIPLSSLAG